MPLRAVVADDDERFRAAVLDVLALDPRIAVLEVAANGPDAVAAAVRHRPDVVLLDLRMPDGGAHLVREIASGSGATVVVLSADLDARTVGEVLPAGARGVLAKGNLAELLPEFVARCCAGEVVLATPSAHRALSLLLEG